MCCVVVRAVFSAFDSSPGAAHHINYGATANWESASTETPICQPKCIPGFEDDGYMATTAVVLGNTGALASSFFNTGDFCVEACKNARAHTLSDRPAAGDAILGLR